MTHLKADPFESKGLKPGYHISRFHGLKPGALSSYGSSTGFNENGLGENGLGENGLGENGLRENGLRENGIQLVHSPPPEGPRFCRDRFCPTTTKLPCDPSSMGNLSTGNFPGPRRLLRRSHLARRSRSRRSGTSWIRKQTLKPGYHILSSSRVETRRFQAIYRSTDLNLHSPTTGGKPSKPVGGIAMASSPAPVLW